MKNIDFSANKGEFHIILGPSGSGKTSLIQIISTLLNPTNGKINLFGEKLDKISNMEKFNIKKKIGYLFQTPYFPKKMSMIDYMMMKAQLSGCPIKIAEKRAINILNDLNLIHLKDKYPTSLSRGERQRISLASLLISNIELLLLDEPTGSIDYINKKIVWDLIIKNYKQNLTIILVTHDKKLCTLADFIYSLNNRELSLTS